MNARFGHPHRGLLAAVLFTALAPTASAQGYRSAPIVVDTIKPAGVLRTIATNGNSLDPSNPFFRSLGTNGRSCVSCHVPANGWSISPRELQLRFEFTNGLDPVFRTVDGSNSPFADVATRAKRKSAYSMLLSKGVIRVELPIPAVAEFSLVHVDDPYNYASAAGLSLFRRPMPSTNLRFISGVMWDGRETVVPFGTTAATVGQNGANLIQDLMHQAADAVTGHAQASHVPPDEVLQQIVNFELNLTTAQQRDLGAGSLSEGGALGGAANLAQVDFYITVNDVLGGDVLGIPFDGKAMSLFKAWNKSRIDRRAAIARAAA
jgi:cytochrome c peroxidase